MDSHNEEKARATKEVIDSFVAKAEAETFVTPAHVAHSHCHKCGAEAHGWKPEDQTWWCGRCAAAEDHERLARWFLQHFDEEIKEGGLSDNVIRLLSQRDDVPSLPEKKAGSTRFSIVCTMKDRWVPHFLAALKYMQQLGSMGGSRVVSFVADGDGDFRPIFKWDTTLPSDAEPVTNNDGDKTFDAG